MLAATPRTMPESTRCAVLLHDMRSAHNVGAIFRTCDAAGVSKIWLSGYAPRPLDRFGRTQKEIAKTALGAELSVPWEYREAPQSLIGDLKNEGWLVAGAEQDARAIDHRSFRLERPTLFLFGTEVDGLSQELRDSCDVLLEIKQYGSKESLNVSVAAGIVLFACAQP